MKLISLQIENFGSLMEYTYLFKDGINTVIHENGWGKSTLAAFIRVMFYGFDNEGRRSELENERKKYCPWQGGTYGGMIVFETKGKKYRIERTFNEKKGGTFAVYDAETNLETKEFSENIGEELFGIDAGSFEKTVFIGQQDCETRATSAINAKIGNLADNTADMGQYEEVQERLKKEADSLTPFRKTGAIMRLKDDIASKEAKITPKESIKLHRDDIAAQIERIKELKSENNRRIKKAQEEMKKLSVIKDLKEKKAEYERLKKALEEAEADYNKLNASFGDKEPDEEELKEMLQKAGDLSSYDQIMKDFRLNENERREEERIYDEYPDDFPEDEEIARLLSLHNESTAKKNALVSKKANLKLMQDLKEKERSDAEEAYKKGLITGIGFIVLGTVLFAAGAFLLSAVKSAAYVLIAAAFAAVCCGLIKLLKRRRYVEKDDGTLIELEEDIAGDEAFIEKTEQAVEAFLKKLSRQRPEDGNIGIIFEKVREDKRKSKEFSRRREKFDEAHKHRDELIKEINAYIVSFGGEESADPNAQLSGLRERFRELNASERVFETEKEAVEAFKRDNDTDKLEEDIEGGDHSMEELNERFNDLQKENEELSEKLRQYGEELEGCDEELSDMEEIEDELVSMKERLSELQYRYDIICDTRDYLERAKNSFSARYMEPIKRAFDKYYGVLSCNDGREYELDANLNINLRSLGVSRDTGLMSDGYRDLVGLCRRMAMIEAMYKEETPFLIMDDPFVNLDNDRVKGGINVLKRISDNYQIIYFTCHDSRAV